MAEETISEIKYMSVESSQTEKKKEKKKENDRIEYPRTVGQLQKV